MKETIFILLSAILIANAGAQNYPSFGPEKPVTINGWAQDAMEPFISPDGNALFFNNLNDGVSTSIYYAARVNDTVFQYVGLFPIVNQNVSPRLDAVPSMDVHQNFYWVSTRAYPSDMENLHHVTITSSGYSNFGRVHGNIYVREPGWIIMDACVSYSGNNLYYCNARFSTCTPMPCFSKIGIGEKINDSTFQKLENSETLLSNINDTLNYIIYAPAISKDGLELYYTRAPINGFTTEILVASRTDTLSAFSLPEVIDASDTSEGPTITSDNRILYYHKKINGKYQIVMRYRTTVTGIMNPIHLEESVISVFPNPAKKRMTVRLNQPLKSNNVMRLTALTGELLIQREVSEGDNQWTLEVSHLNPGIYFVHIGESFTRLGIE